MNNKLYFENTQGKAEMFLSGAGPVRVTALSGLGNPQKKYNTVTFAGRDGQKTVSTVAQARTIIIRGDIRLSDKGIAERIMRVLHEPGNLILDFDDKKRMIYCSQVDFEEISRNRGFMDFMLTLTADGVYFTDIHPTEKSAFERKDMLGGDIVFPCIFTEKTTEAFVENYGEVNVEPVIKIYSFDDTENGEILISNNTTGQSVKIKTELVKKEVVTIDISSRKVTSTVKGNITHLISDDSFLNKFWLAPGKNHICASHSNEGKEISIVCSYYSNYREGIY